MKMKTHVCLCLFLFLFIQNGKAQSDPAGERPASSYTVVTDTLHYYLNKYYFKTGTTNLKNYPGYKSPAATSTAISHVGSKFENFDTLLVTGIECYAFRYSIGTLLQPLHLFLCNINPITGMPVLPPIDSIKVFVGGNPSNGPVRLGGDFTVPHTLLGNFALLFRNMSGLMGDTLHLMRTACKTATNTGALPSEKFSDGLGIVRYDSTFYSATNFTATGFGWGTDYEFMIAPRVKYHLRAGHVKPAILADTICTRTPLTFTNTSSRRYTSRFYNLNEFYRKWNLYSPFVAQPLTGGGFSADSSITWYFEYNDGLTPPRDPRVFLPYFNNGTVTAISDRPGCFTSNAFRACLRPMNAFGRSQQLSYSEEFTICMKYCNDAVSVTELQKEELVKIYPNPCNTEYVTIRSPKSIHQVLIYDALGKLVTTQTSADEVVRLDTKGLDSGIYLLKVFDESGIVKPHKLVIQH